MLYIQKIKSKKIGFQKNQICNKDLLSRPYSPALRSSWIFTAITGKAPVAIATLRQRNFWLLLILLFCYTIVGTVGHTPWKQDEAYSFGIIQHMFETGQWLIPTNAGQPFMEKPPLFYWTATLSSQLFQHWLPLHDAARIATLFYSLLNSLFLFLLALRCLSYKKTPLNTRGLAEWRVMLVVMICASTPGLLKHSHDLFTDVALYTGATIALYGLQGMINLQGKWSGDFLWFSLGIVMTFLSKGFFIPGLLVICSLLIPLLVISCRTRSYLWQIIVAGLIALPFMLAWPLAVYHYSPPIFNEWFWQNNIGRFVGFSVKRLGAAANHWRILDAILFFAFPAGILALLFIARIVLEQAKSAKMAQSRVLSRLKIIWHRATHPSIALCLLFVLLGIGVLQASSTSRHLYLLPFISPLSILALHGLVLLPTKIVRAWSKGSMLFFGLLALLVWLVYLATLSPLTMPCLSWLGRWLPLNFQMPIQPLPLLFALSLSIIWLLYQRWFLHHRAFIAAVQQWFIGMTLLWGLIFSLLLPWIENAKGYQAVFNNLQQTIAPLYQQGECMASFELGESEAPLLYYYTGILHQPLASLEQPTSCRWLLIEDSKAIATPDGMQKIWQGHRDGDNRERFALFLKKATSLKATLSLTLRVR